MLKRTNLLPSFLTVVGALNLRRFLRRGSNSSLCVAPACGLESPSSQPLPVGLGTDIDPANIRSTRSSSGSMRKRKASGTLEVEPLKEEEEKSEIAPDFECNICFELAKEPVVTCCGHLFCWPCLYQWFHVHCNYRECPVCKGKVNESSIVPIYGRGGSEAGKEKKTEEDGDGELKIPPRPQGNRIESLRQQLQSRTSRRSLEEHLYVLFDEAQPRLQNVNVEGRNPQDSQISASSSILPGGAVSQQRFNIDGSLSRISAILSELRSLTRRNEEVGGVASVDDHRDFEPVHSQTSNSSTMAIIQGIDAATIDASGEPSRGGSSVVPRGRRRRSTALVLRENTLNDASNGPNRRGSSRTLRTRGRSTTGVMEGDTVIATDASAEPNRGGFSMVLRRRNRSNASDSSSAGHESQRRRLD